MVVSKTSDYIHIKIKMPTPNQEPPVSSKVPMQDLKDMDVLCTFKIKIESQYFEQWCIKDYWPYLNQDPDFKPLGPSKSPNQDLKDNDVLCTFKINILRQNLEYGCIKDQWPYPNKYPDVKPQSRTSSTL